MKAFSIFIVTFISLTSFGAPPQTSVERIAFGSCIKENLPQPIWKGIESVDPDLFIMMGDNIYGDTSDLAVLKKKYETLAANTDFSAFRSRYPILATWDDHDYGANDAGAEFPLKKQSEKLFLDFFGEPLGTPRRMREGIYDSKIYGSSGNQVQFILLDTRYFRGPLVKAPNNHPMKWKYVPTKDKKTSVLGEAQWKWLESELLKTADVRVIVTSIEFNGEEQGWEKWGNFPHERKRLIDLIRKTKARGVVLLSGDRHAGYITKNTVDNVPYPLYEVTSSSLNFAFLKHKPPKMEPNVHRLGGVYYEENFGMMDIDWDKAQLHLSLHSVKGQTEKSLTVDLSELQP